MTSASSDWPLASRPIKLLRVNCYLNSAKLRRLSGAMQHVSSATIWHLCIAINSLYITPAPAPATRR